MVLNWLWIGFFTVAFATAAVRWALGDAGIFQALMAALFDGARSGFEISLGLAGVMALWLGLMRVGERAGVIALWRARPGRSCGGSFPACPTATPRRAR